jgi:hypothetical protein
MSGPSRSVVPVSRQTSKAFLRSLLQPYFRNKHFRIGNIDHRTRLPHDPLFYNITPGNATLRAPTRTTALERARMSSTPLLLRSPPNKRKNPNTVKSIHNSTAPRSPLRTLLMLRSNERYSPIKYLIGSELLRVYSVDKAAHVYKSPQVHALIKYLESSDLNDLARRMSGRASNVLLADPGTYVPQHIKTMLNANSATVLKKAYRSASLKYHPNRGGSTEEQQMVERVKTLREGVQSKEQAKKKFSRLIAVPVSEYLYRDLSEKLTPSTQLNYYLLGPFRADTNAAVLIARFENMARQVLTRLNEVYWVADPTTNFELFQDAITKTAKALMTP